MLSPTPFRSLPPSTCMQILFFDEFEISWWNLNLKPSRDRLRYSWNISPKSEMDQTLQIFFRWFIKHLKYWKIYWEDQIQTWFLRFKTFIFRMKLFHKKLTKATVHSFVQLCAHTTGCLYLNLVGGVVVPRRLEESFSLAFKQFEISTPTLV